MNRADPNDLLVLSMSSNGDKRTITLQDGDEHREFHAHFEDAREIRLLVCPDLSRWIMDGGKLWALSQIRDLLDRSPLGAMSDGLPLRLMAPPGTEDE